MKTINSSTFIIHDLSSKHAGVKIVKKVTTLHFFNKLTHENCRYEYATEGFLCSNKLCILKFGFALKSSYWI